MESSELHVLRVVYVVGLACLSISVGILFKSIQSYGETLAVYEKENIIMATYEKDWKQLKYSYEEWARSTSLAMFLILMCDLTGVVAVITMTSCMLRGQILFILTCILCLVINDPFPFPEYLFITTLTGLLEICIILSLIREMDKLNKINNQYLPL